MNLNKIGGYISSLLPQLKKSDMMIDTAHNFVELNTAISAMYETTSNRALSGKTLTNTSSIMSKRIHIYHDNPHKTIKKLINIIQSNEDIITDLIHKEFNDDNVKAIYDYYKINIIKYIEALTFFNDYARMWISVVVWETLAAYLDNPIVTNKETMGSTLPASPNTSPYLISSPTIVKDTAHVNNMDTIESFSVACNILSMPFHSYLDKIKDLKGHTVNETDLTSSHAIADKKFDPFQTNFIPVMWNPVYHIGLSINTWRVARHERNKAELSRLQFMILALKDEQSVNTNPARLKSLENSINYYSNLSNKLAAKIEVMEDQ